MGVIFLWNFLFKIGGDFMETDFLQPLIALISNMGFPIAMSIYLLHRMEQKLDTMIHLLSELNHHLKKE
jgi:hypothetical protein